MKPGPGVRRVIKLACPACGALPDERCAVEFCPERAVAASAW
jgi:hypothetical protein